MYRFRKFTCTLRILHKLVARFFYLPFKLVAPLDQSISLYFLVYTPHVQRLYYTLNATSALDRILHWHKKSLLVGTPASSNRQQPIDTIPFTPILFSRARNATVAVYLHILGHLLSFIQSFSAVFIYFLFAFVQSLRIAIRSRIFASGFPCCAHFLPYLIQDNRQHRK